MSAGRVVVGVAAGLAAVAGAAALVWRARGTDAGAADVNARVPRGDGKAVDVLLPIRVKDRADFVAQMRNAMAVELPQLGKRGRQLLIAHAAYESGWGAGKAFRAGWNFGNITAGSSWRGEKWVDRGGDTEFNEKTGATKTIDQEWRKYASLTDAVRDYWAFLGGPRYLTARNVLEHSNGLDSDAFCASLRAGGYYTLQLAAYQRGLSSVVAQVTPFYA